MTSFSYANRKTSLKELPSYREQASQALNRQDELRKIKERLSLNRDLLHGDPSSKPWLRKTSLPVRKSPEQLERRHREAAEFEPTHLTGTYTATPAQIVSMTEERIRNFSSRGTSASRESDEILDFY